MECNHGQEITSCVFCHYEATVDRPDPNAELSCPRCSRLTVGGLEKYLWEEDIVEEMVDTRRIANAVIAYVEGKEG